MEEARAPNDGPISSFGGSGIVDLSVKGAGDVICNGVLDSKFGGDWAMNGRVFEAVVRVAILYQYYFLTVFPEVDSRLLRMIWFSRTIR